MGATDMSIALPLTLSVCPALWLHGCVGDQAWIEFSDILDTNDWRTLTTLTLENTPQLYLDTNALGQPQRFYRAKVHRP